MPLFLSRLLLLLISMMMIISLTSVSYADDLAKVEKQIRSQLNFPVQSIRAQPGFAGLYEVIADSNIFYTDATGRYLINGHVFNTKSREDLTAERLDQLSIVRWKDLPLDKAIVSGDPDGTPIAVFTDPDCPFCKQLEPKLAQLNGLKVYTFLWPLTSIHPDAMAHAKSIWCAKDKHKALVDLMVHDKTLPEGTCETPLADITELAQRIGLRGTPTIIGQNGRKIKVTDLESIAAHFTK
ncbi:MAG: DsbC family protein [Mariprofundales bacterium]